MVLHIPRAPEVREETGKSKLACTLPVIIVTYAGGCKTPLKTMTKENRNEKMTVEKAL
jgi:hypothetical protein